MALLLFAGDVGKKPAPYRLDNALIESEKQLAGETMPMNELQEIKGRMVSIDRALFDLNTRITEPEEHCQALPTIQTNIKTVQYTASQTKSLVHDLELRLGDAKNRSRKNKVDFDGLSGSCHRQRFAESETFIIDHCFQHV